MVIYSSFAAECGAHLSNNVTQDALCVGNVECYDGRMGTGVQTTVVSSDHTGPAMRAAPVADTPGGTLEPRRPAEKR